MLWPRYSWGCISPECPMMMMMMQMYSTSTVAIHPAFQNVFNHETYVPGPPNQVRIPVGCVSTVTLETCMLNYPCRAVRRFAVDLFSRFLCAAPTHISQPNFSRRFWSRKRISVDPGAFLLAWLPTILGPGAGPWELAASSTRTGSRDVRAFVPVVYNWWCAVAVCL